MAQLSSRTTDTGSVVVISISDGDDNENREMQNSNFKPKRGQANRRERVRTENVNAGFDKLRKLIPTEPEDRKLSKIEILRLATSYIKHLYNLTRASSCLEAEDMDRATTNRDDQDAEYTVVAKKRPRHHVCTFCLMISKQHQQGATGPTKKQVAR